jgi:anhydro-N-acetylmuramic acid kinase
MNNQKEYYIIGCMSGTSLDGIDLALCRFIKRNGQWNFQILSAETIPYSEEWKKNLEEASFVSGLKLFRIDHQYGKYIGEVISEFISRQTIHPDYIASHGHTVFHEPGKGGSLQIGNGHDIYARTGLTVIADFRSLDVALGGQGAPLVPVGDRLLFPEYYYCLNLGGFSNISFTLDEKLIAYDICPVNTILNYYSKLGGTNFDSGGKLGRKGEIIYPLLNQMNSLDFYKNKPPRSLGREFLEEFIFPLTKRYNRSPEDLLATCYEHISTQIADNLNNDPRSHVLVTGGGAWNEFLIEKIKEKTNNPLVLPEKWVIDFKEALVFGFLGVLRLEGLVNCLASVTGARSDSCCGLIYGEK